MPVSSGRWLSNSVNASSPPAEAPTPTTLGSELPLSRSSGAGRMIGTPETGFTAAGGVFPGEVARRFGLGDSAARGERATPPRRRLPFFFAERNYFLSRRDERALI